MNMTSYLCVKVRKLAVKIIISSNTYLCVEEKNYNYYEAICEGIAEGFRRVYETVKM